MPPKRVIILGSTGSIGTQTLDVIAHLNGLHARGAWPYACEVVGLAAGGNAGLLAQQAKRLGVGDVALAERCSESSLDGLRCRFGPDAATALVRDVECDVVVAAIVGAAGLKATLEAVHLGRDVALANKESLVCAGEVVIAACKESGARLLPIDSEHAAVWQCLRGACLGEVCPPLVVADEVSRVILTASGGPFRNQEPREVYHAPRAMALAHPTWNMGPKVTIDCATMMNKGLELIEAHWLFGLPASRLGAVIQPQSLVHCLVELVDGSVLAQASATDMRMPIQHALTYPHRVPGSAARLDVARLGRLEFHEAQPDRFPAIGLAMRAIEAGGTAGAILNAANEEAVHAYLRGEIPFGRIVEHAAEAFEAIAPGPAASLASVVEADARARDFVRHGLGR